MSRNCRRSRAAGVGGPAGGSNIDGGRRRGSIIFSVRDFFRQIGSGGGGGSRRKQSNPVGTGSAAGPSGLSAGPSTSAAANSASIESIASADDGQHGQRRRNPAAAVADIAGQVECPVCAERQPLAQFPAVLLDCEHFACHACLRTSLRLSISEGLPSTCLSCNNRLHPADVDAIVDEERLRLKYEQFTLRRVLAADPDCRWCPAPDCKYAVIATGCASCPKLDCPVCRIEFCYHCKTEWHPNTTCEQARIQRQTAEVLAAARAGADIMSLSSRSESIAEIKQCPRCATYITKENDGSCNHMRCKMCGAEFCWLCRKEITDLHYLSPSGCTFWGKKPWSRKKKILWQLGTLVGAPLGIALLAGLAVPAITIGVPVWVGEQVNNRLKRGGGVLQRSRARRHCVVILAVCGSMFLSPVVAVLGVGVSVPILLAYVYGVVPVSLCRSNGCGLLQDEDADEDDYDDESGPRRDDAAVFSGARPAVELANYRAAIFTPGSSTSANAVTVGSSASAAASAAPVAPVASVEHDLASGTSADDSQTEESISLVLVSSGREAKVAAAGVAASAAAAALQQHQHHQYHPVTKLKKQKQQQQQQCEDESQSLFLLQDQQSDSSNSVVSFKIVGSHGCRQRSQDPSVRSQHQHQTTVQAEVLTQHNQQQSAGAAASAGCRIGSFESLDDKRSCSLSVYTVDTNDASMLGLTGSIAGARDPDGKSVSIISEDRQPIVEQQHHQQQQAHTNLIHNDGDIVCNTASCQDCVKSSDQTDSH